ncbi:MAG: PIG-L family deacetylase [Gemmatales bacterium]|nr:PIG-L family deacetylase [Gemmatales bacterium]MDW8385754.1 PIG-L family deacetylase [Gemmatales bacterium]
MVGEPLRLLIVGAHPDDAEYYAGGLAALYRRAGHTVKMVSFTNGDAGHFRMRGPELAARRRAEAESAAAVIGGTYEILDLPDGKLQPTLENRWRMIRLLREFQPDLVLTHRPCDYHPDHRAVSQLVQDAAYLVTVPAVVPEVPHLASDPVIAYLPDDFRKPYPFEPTVFVAVDEVVHQIVDMLHCHASQFYEWLPYNRGIADQVPTTDEERKAWLARQVLDRLERRADRYRDRIGPKVRYLEMFEACEYGSPLDEAAKNRLFPPFSGR